ncbi:helix-turn-helix transcriptional regulator [Draconibacterium orientale]|uniref:helix-turn-helix domain-containing protein n=1 Tax=Draconibacterium orientale TaxID=1168034 RepID=UPI002A0A4753|nr:helix-turn-helix transcriptional regulator [Draconibacterium orientale]
MKKSTKDSKGSYEPVTKVKDTHHELLKRIGIELEERRKEKNISVTTLCDKVGISRTTYYRITKGMIYFNIQKMLDLLDELGANVTINFRDNNTTEQA